MFNKLLEFNSSRYRLEEKNKSFASAMEDGSLVLDAGCGDAPYKYLFSNMRYESADLTQTDRAFDRDITYICDLNDIPVKSGRFDYVVCNQVLEHIPEPQTVINELFRVLKPGGKVLFTAPLFYQEHEHPYDFNRYTQFAWRRMLENAGFRVDEVEPLEGFFGLCGYFFQVMYQYLPRKSKDIGGKTGALAAPLLSILHPFLAINAILFHRLERHAKVKVGIVGGKNYAVIATKPTRKRKQS